MHGRTRAADEKLMAALVAVLVGIAIVRGGWAAVLVAISIEAAVLLWRAAGDSEVPHLR